MAGDIKLPNIVSKVHIDSKGVDQSLSSIGSSVSSTGGKFSGLQKSASGAIDSISSSLTSQLGPAGGKATSVLNGLAASGSLMGPAIAGGAALAGVAVAKFALDGAQQFVALAGEIRNFQRASGASAEESSRFVAVLDDLGISSETGASALFKLGRKAADGGADLAKFGIEVARTKDGAADLTGTLQNVADQYVATTDPAKRAELAFAAFGKQGQALVPVLEQGRAGLKAFFEGAESGRQIFSQEDLDKARKYELAIDDLQDTFRGLKLQAGEALLPFLTTLAEVGTKTLGFVDTLKDKAPGAFDALKSAAAGAVGGPIAQLIDGISNVGSKSDGTKRSTKELAEATKQSAIAAQEAAVASDAQAKALDRVLTATLATLSSQLGYQSSVNTLKDNINDLDDKTEAYTEAVNKNGASSKEAESANRALRDAHLGIEQSAVAAASAAVRLADDTATAGGQALTAQEKSDVFRNALISLANQADGPTRNAILGLADQIIGLPDRTVTIDADTSAAVAAIQSLERRLNSISAGANSTSGPQQFARGMDVGPVQGPAGAAVPIIAHAGEWVLTPEQLARLGRGGDAGAAGSPVGPGPSGPFTPPMVHTTIVLDRKVLAQSVSRGQHENRPR